MSFNYALADRYANYVHALAITETNECPTMTGDGGRAFGILQQHPAFFAEYYRPIGEFKAEVSDTWIDAEIKACACFWSMWEHRGVDLVVQAYNQGITAVMVDGVRAPEYLAKFTEALNKVRGTKQ